MSTSLPLMFEDGGGLTPVRGGTNPPALAEADRKLHVFTRQWTRHQLSVRAYLASFLGNSIAVDDCIQDVALVVWQKGPWDGDSSAFLGYCLACARRIALAARRQRGDTRLELLSPEAATALADRVAFQEQQDTTPPGERMDALRKCLEKIKPEHRELLESRYSGESKEELRELSKRGGKSMDVLYKTLERLRFEATLRETINPQRMEVLESRRMIFAPGADGPEWSVEQQHSVRIGQPHEALTLDVSPPKKRSLAVVLLAGALLTGIVAAWFLWPRSQPAPTHWLLRNSDFEATDLSLSPQGVTTALVDWQDVFFCPEADLVEIGRFT